MKDKILDSDLEEDISSMKRDKKSFIYSSIMLIGGCFFLYYTTIAGENAILHQLLIASFCYQLFCISIGLIVSLLSKMIKKQLKEVNLFMKSFIFDVIENGFILWLFLTGVVLLNKFVL